MSTAKINAWSEKSQRHYWTIIDEDSVLRFDEEQGLDYHAWEIMEIKNIHSIGVLADYINSGEFKTEVVV